MQILYTPGLGVDIKEIAVAFAEKDAYGMT
jgi:hypothetical protein